jgi:prohead serine protease
MAKPGKPEITVSTKTEVSVAAPTPSAGPRTVDVLPFALQARVLPKSINEETRTIDVVLSTGAAVERMDWWTGKRYIETLSLDEGHVRLDRLNEGGPLLDSHSSWSVSDLLGSVVPGSVTLNKKEMRARVAFSRRAAVEPVWQDVKDGHVRSLSIGYRIYKFEETEGKNNALPVRKAIDWEPYEASMVSMPADAGAKVRDGRSADANQCQIVTRAQGAQERSMKDDETPSETIVEGNALPKPTPAPTATEPNERDEATTAERARNLGIQGACRAARLPSSFADKLIRDGVSLLDAQTRVFEELQKRDVDAPRAGSRGPQVEVTGDDPLVHVRAGIENALLHRMYPHVPEIKNGDGRILRHAQGFQLSDEGRQYRGMTMLDVARAYLTQRGVRVTSMSKMELAGVALGLRGGMHTNSDFANLLSDLPNKLLRQAYLEAPQTFSAFTRPMTLSDFKKARLLQLGEAPALLEVGEHGEYTEGTMGESKEEVQLKTWGRKFSITRQALVNDDTDAFSRVPMAFGRQARNKESDLVWAEINNNANMGDGVALFHATHANLSGTSDAISVASIGAGRTALRKQTGIDGVSLMNLEPKLLIVPAAKETIADQFVSQNLLASQSSNVNPFAGKLAVVAEPRLDVSSGVSWYLAASPDQVDIIVLATLEGESGPRVDSRVGFDVDGLEIKISHDVIAKVVDFRGLWKNPGA